MSERDYINEGLDDLNEQRWEEYEETLPEWTILRFHEDVLRQVWNSRYGY